MIDHLRLLSTLKVKKIYWVDDENARQEDLDITKLAEALAKKISENDSELHFKNCLDALTAEISGQALKLARQVVKDIRAAWDAKDDYDPIDKILDALNRLLGDFPADRDPKAVLQVMLGKLPQPFSLAEKQALASAFDGKGDWEWRPISFTQWASEYQEILADHNGPENSALLIVDLQNDRESSATTGENVLEQWASWVENSGSTRSVFAIAFTSLWKPDDEIKAGRTFTNRLFPGGPKKNQLPVLVLSKTRLQLETSADADDEAGAAAHDAFKRALGRLRACALHWDLAEDVQKLFTDSVAEAFKTLQELSIEELLMAVSGKHTQQEGASDVDTLVRMAAVAQRAALLNKIAQNEGVASTLIELRGLSEVVTEFNRKLLVDTSGIERLRASEVHDPGQVVNALLSPLATGDIFEVICSGQTEYHVLVSNICDLTLRGHTGRRKIEDGLLLRLGAQEQGKVDEDDKAFKVLPSFPQDSPLAGKQWVAKYNYISIVPLDVLDLCWTNQDGNCQWQAAAAVLGRLAPSQRLRLDALLESFKKQPERQRIASRLSGVEMQLSLNEAQQLSQVKFAVRRVGRMAHAFAHAVSEGFGRNVARHSFEHDISAGS